MEAHIQPETGQIVLFRLLIALLYLAGIAAWKAIPATNKCFLSCLRSTETGQSGASLGPGSQRCP
jgi:hypothetical protein